MARRALQLATLGLTVWAVFHLGANAEAWCPLGGVEAIYTYWAEGNMICSLAVSNFFILGGMLVATLLVRRGLCGYLCPIGTISDLLARGGRRLGLRRLKVARPIDLALSLLKYLVLAVILVFTWRAGELLFRGYCPAYALVSRHGADITFWAYVVAASIAVGSLVVWMPFCRWFCPLAAVLNPWSRFGLTRVKRDAATCIGCGRCAGQCPMAIPVDRVQQVTHARCISCLSCVDACPERQRALRWGPPDWLARRWHPAVLIAILLISTSAAAAASYLWPMASFIVSREQPPREVAQVEVAVENLTCRGRGNLLWYFLQRDDLYRLPGYLKLEAWPGPGWSRTRITYDPRQTNDGAIRRAITEFYYDVAGNHWRESPFRIQGYDPLAEVR